ncbi:unnamed protein product [Cuscuta europaea]|uniref:Reverse transcriptase zinc-binding domain-containing protein n=1 Tax=Cuscuta europaea TaxID=41803 RepID=A0A9P0YYN8_CUSEU|nr:unnamed protein product [Cuscuta europaea]
MKIKLLQWKILNGILPITDNLGRFQQMLNLSMCPLCKSQSDFTEYLLYCCEHVQPTWSYFMGIFGITAVSSSYFSGLLPSYLSCFLSLLMCIHNGGKWFYAF